MGRPRANIDGAEVEKLASFGLKDTEIAALLDTSPATIGRRFAKETTKGRENLKKSLRRKQIEVALSGNVTMLIWLGKNLLDQTDKQEVKTISDADITAAIERELARLADKGQTKDAAISERVAAGSGEVA